MSIIEEIIAPFVHTVGNTCHYSCIENNVHMYILDVGSKMFCNADTWIADEGWEGERADSENPREGKTKPCLKVAKQE
ncbi:MAG TPA: hypothetical protein VFI73_01120 [Candidatus Nitrosopolaris sp.]|nr:hypothetical protein [Candidatus Nitrosopolaris sp.]